MTGTALIEIAPAVRIVPFEAIDGRVRDYLAAGTAPATLRAYAADWAHFTAWCEEHDAVALPAAPETVVRYLSDLAKTRKVATLTRRTSAISRAHQAAGHDSPTHAALVRGLFKGIRRVENIVPAAKAPVTVDDMRNIMSTHLPAGLKGTRDRALLLVGFAGAFRRSELVGIDAEHVEFVTEGMVITLPHSKTDQEGAGRRVAIPYGLHVDTCPVSALLAWLDATKTVSGPVFRPVDRHGRLGAERLTDRSVALVVKHYMALIGRDTYAYAGHSLRAGFATAAARGGAHERDIMRQTGHRSTAMVRRYIREGNLFRANAAVALGL